MEPHRTGRNEPHASTLEPGRALGPYLVLSTLSTGARSTVYMAQDLSLDRPVALKTAPRGSVSVIGEARVLARFNHPHIVTLHGLWAQPPTLILEYLVGETLKARRERLGALPDTHIKNWMVAILSALETIHGQGLAHGAVRSDNIFLTTDQRIKLLDFRQTSLGESPPMPADDVRAAGRLMQELLDSETGALPDIARGGLLGRYATARAFRLAMAAVPGEAIPADITTEAQDLALAQASLAMGPTELAAEAPSTDQVWESIVTPARTERPGLAELFEEPSINPMLPSFHERPGWGRPNPRRKRVGIILAVVLIMGFIAAALAWPHRQQALRPVTHIAHTMVQLAHGLVPQRTTTPAPRKARAALKASALESHPQTASETHLRPGAYAALAHAWGG